VVRHLPADVEALYEEARIAASAGAHTASVLSLRKLLMHVAVALDAPENQPFVVYVEYLADQGYVPPNGRGWVDQIRVKGNEANHEIVLISAEDNEQLIRFVGMLLKFIYEFPAEV
jgi:hypothetical protein